MRTQNIIQLRTLADLRDQSIENENLVFMVAKAVDGDGLGGFYQWIPTATDPEDATYLNSVISNYSATGRWLRVFQRAKIVPQGVLVNNAGVKTLYVMTTTAADGTATINLTTDNTPGGPPIFKEIFSNDSRAYEGATNVATAIQSYFMSGNLQTTKHGYYKANAVTILVSTLYNPLISVGAGIPVRFKVEGI